MSDPQNIEYANPLTNRLDAINKKRQRARVRQRIIDYAGALVYAGLAVFWIVVYFLTHNLTLATHLEFAVCEAFLIWRGWEAFKGARA